MNKGEDSLERYGSQKKHNRHKIIIYNENKILINVSSNKMKYANNEYDMTIIEILENYEINN